MIVYHGANLEVSCPDLNHTQKEQSDYIPQSGRNRQVADV